VTRLRQEQSTLWPVRFWRFLTKQPTIWRWIDVVLYSLISITLIWLVFGEGNTSSLAVRLSDIMGDQWLGLAVVAGSLLVAAWWIHKLAGFKPAQLLRYPKIPGFPLAVLLVLVFQTLAIRWSNQTHPTNPEYFASCLIACGYGSVLLLTFIAAAFVRRSETLAFASKPPLDAALTPLSLSDLEIDKLHQWINLEREITECDEDYLGLTPRALRVLGILREREHKCVAIVGPYGSGKSSLLNLVQAEAERQDATANRTIPALWFCRFSCWGVEKGDSLPQAMLRRVVEELGKRIDCLSVRGLPLDYTKALSKLHSHVEVFFSVAGAGNPDEQLERLSPLLQTVGARLVIALEDVDRNGDGFDVHQIEGLLTRLRNVNDITFVISAGQDCKLDFLRLVEHSEVLPLLDAKVADSIISRVVNTLRDDTRVIFPVPHPEMSPEERRVNEALAARLRSRRGYSQNDDWHRQLLVLLNTPRVFKSAIRRFLRAWENLKGEVNDDELLVASALREAAPRHFAFVQRHWDDFSWLSASTENNPVEKQLRAEWDQLSNSADRIATEKLLVALFPPLKPLVGATAPWTMPAIQSLAHPIRGPVYRDRIFNESLTPGTLLDQPLLHLIDESNKSTGAPDELVRYLLTDSEQWDHFYLLQDKFLRRDRLQLLLSSIFSHLKERDGRKACLSSTELVRLCIDCAEYSRNEPRKNFDWYRAQVLACVPNHLTLAGGLLLSLTIYKEDRERLRSEVAAKMAQDFSITSSDPQEALRQKDVQEQALIGSINDDAPDTLFRLVAAHDNPGKWFGPLMLRAVRHHPDVAIPQILRFIWPALQNLHPDVNKMLISLFGETLIPLMQQITMYPGSINSWNVGEQSVTHGELRRVIRNHFGLEGQEAQPSSGPA
jgi:hypothetical protein